MYIEVLWGYHDTMGMHLYWATRLLLVKCFVKKLVLLPFCFEAANQPQKMTNIFCKLKKSTNCLMAKWPLCCFKNCVKQSINKCTLAIAIHLVNKVYCSLEPYTLRTNPINTSWHWKRYCPFNYYIAEVCALKNPVCCLYFFTSVLNQFDQG